MTQMMDVTGSLRKLAKDCLDIGVDIDKVADVPFELVARIGAVSFMLHWIADGLDREFELAAERGKQQQAIAGKRCFCGNWTLYPNGTCGPSGCINCPA